MNRKDWDRPPGKYRVNPIIHDWPKTARTELMDAVKDFGFGGVVTNPPHENWYEGYRDNVRQLAEIIKELEERGLSFWIYDENGYPSGYAGGETLKGHPELEAKGFYMRRTVAYEPRHVKFRLDCESDRIVWAARYPMECPGMHESYVQFDKMVPVPFTDEFCETDLGEKEAFYVFCVKSAYEGSHCTHNVCSYSRYINVMEPKAIRRFIDLVLEPIAEEIPDAFEKAGGVFTDEPSLQVGYARNYESWPYALAPWSEDLFEAYEEEYGQSILPRLPLIFEGGKDAYPIRINFYRLVGKLIAKAYSGQLAQWCEAHGGRLSGHYLGEESMVGHVRDYGSYVEVLSRASYPGLDVLCCYPEIFSYNTVKHPQMAARKMGADGMMVELCPFVDRENFEKDPIENMTGVVTTLFMSGVRVTNSYFSSNFEEYNPQKLVGRNGYMHRADALAFNNYVGRMGVMLDGLTNDCNTFVYYGIEDVQAKMVPQTSAFSGPETEAGESEAAFTHKLFEAGHDFYYADRDDLTAAAAVENGRPLISGHEVKNLIIPALDVMYEDAYAAVLALAGRGVKVYFLDKVPDCGATEPVIKTDRTDFVPCTAEEILAAMDAAEEGLHVDADGAMILKARFNRDGRELWMVENNTRSEVSARITHSSRQQAELYNPVDGSVTPVHMGENVRIPSLRAVFLLFE